MNVYAPLQHYLSEHDQSSVVLTYDQIESLIGRKLPPTAYGNHKRQWWANTESHSQALAWLRANRKAKLDVNLDQVVFKREPSESRALSASATPSPLRLDRSRLQAGAIRMLEDIAEEHGGSLDDAAVVLLNEAARRRRKATLSWFADNTIASDVSSAELVRGDRDAR